VLQPREQRAAQVFLPLHTIPSSPRMVNVDDVISADIKTRLKEKQVSGLGGSVLTSPAMNKESFLGG